VSVVDGLAAANFTDPHNQRIIYLAVGGLLLLAVIVAVGTIVWWRSTKAEHPALAPLEVMSTRKFEKSDYTDRKRVLDEVRPPGHPTDADDDAVSDVVDLQAASEAPLPDPAELADPEHPIPSEGPTPTPEAEVANVRDVPDVHEVPEVPDAVEVSEEPVAVDVASGDDATVATELPVATAAQPSIVAE
jgi:hypothetical protein